MIDPDNDFDDQAHTQPQGEEEWDEDFKSKSQLKREVLELTDLGRKLVELNDAHLKRIPMPENVESAVMEARRIKAFGARKRQIKFIGGQLRKVDAEPLFEALREIEQEGRTQIEKEHRITRWRDRLIEEGDQALGELLAEHTELDRQHLRQLIRNAVREKKNSKPPASARSLLRYLRDQGV